MRGPAGVAARTPTGQHRCRAPACYWNRLTRRVIVRSKALLRSFGAALLCVSPAAAADPVLIPAGGPGCAPPIVQPPCTVPSPQYPSAGSQIPSLQQPGSMQQPNAAQPPATDAFAQAPPTGGEAAQTGLPQMIGDLGFYGVAPRFPSNNVSLVTVPGLTLAQINQKFNLSPQFPTAGFTGLYFDLNNSQQFTAAQLNALTKSTSFSSSSSSSSQSSSSLSNRVPVTSFGSFKISDNESAAPTDRVFATYNYYDVDGFHGNSSSINREMIGFEKTFLDGRASFGIRAPYTEVGEGLGGSSDFDSLSLIGKYAVYQDREAGNVISAGLVVTVPTGPDIFVGPGTINPTLIQPYVGYALSFGRAYVQGFSEIIIPTDNSLPTFVANDIGIGYRLEAIPIIPTFEVHANDALNHQGSAGSPIGFVDNVTLTGGFHTLIGNSVLTLGAATPVTGPRLTSIEAIVEFNWHF
jgi:hypothetical protein